MTESKPPTPKPRKIPTPLPRRMLYVRQRFVPVIVWFAALGLALFLMQQQTPRQLASGFAEVREVSVASSTTGRIASLLVDLFDEVEANQVIALLDDSPLRAELETATREIERLRAEQVSISEEIRWDQWSMERREFIDLRRMALDVSQARLDLLDRITVRESQKADLELLRIVFERQRQLLEREAIDRSTFDETRFRLEALEVTLAESEVAIAAAQELVEESSRRLEELQERTGERMADVEAMLAPLTEAIAVQEARLAEIESHRETLVLRAPVDGVVSEVLLREGSAAIAGAPIATVTERTASRIVAWVDESILDGLHAGSKVEVRTTGTEPRIFEARIERFSPRVEELPLRLQTHPLMLRWGRQMLVTDFPEGAVLPGERVDLRPLPDSV